MRLQQPSQGDPPLDRGILDKLLGFHVRLAQLAIHEGFERNAPLPGMTPGQLTILVLIDRNAGLTQQKLCTRLRVKKSTLAVALHRLAHRRLLRRVRSTRDRRENALCLTAKGKAELNSLLRYALRYERLLARRITGAERQTLIRLLGKIARPR
jgi:DNA-binding MarR family transcriptional regulator